MAEFTKHFKNCLGVFQGGGCKALAFVGAYREAEHRGVFFSQLAGTSAGSIVAALIAAGASPEYLTTAVLDADFKSFAAKPDGTIRGGRHTVLAITAPFLSSKYQLAIRFMRSLGIYSSSEIENWLEGHLRHLLKSEGPKPVTFADLNIPLHVVATEVGTTGPMVWSSERTPNKSVAYAVRCSCTIPIFFQPVAAQYVDGGVVSNLPTFVLDRAQRTSFEKMLSFTFKPVVEDIVATSGRFDPEQYVRRLVGTVIDSGVTIQSSFTDNIHVIEIGDLQLETLDFDKIDAASIALMIEGGAKAASAFFNSETTRLRRDGNARATLHSEPQALNQIVREMVGAGDEVVISLRTTRYVYNLFPTFLAWRMAGADVRFSTLKVPNTPLGTNTTADHETFRRLILACLGATLRETDSLPFEGFLFRRISGPGNAIVFDSNRADASGANFAVKYDSLEDTAAIEGLFRMLDLSTVQSNPAPEIKIYSGGLNKVVDRLKTLAQYRPKEVSINLEVVEVSKIIFLTKYVKSYKYGQIHHLFSLYEQYGLRLFESVEISYHGIGLDVSMPITPPVAEEHGGKLYLIEGNSRLTYLIKEKKVPRLSLLVIRNVSARLPTSGEFRTTQLLISDEDKMGPSRYENWAPSDYRHIEEAVRRPKIYI